MMKKVAAVLLLLFLAWFSFAEDEEFDDFDLLFEDAGEDIIVEEAPVPVVDVTSETTSDSSSTPQIISFSGSFTGNVGAVATWKDEELDGGGALSFTNTLFMTAKPASDFSIHASVKTTESNLTLDLSSFYFDYLWKSFYLSAGKKSLTWGNVRLFNTETYGDVLTNVLSDFSPLVAEVQFPLAGSWTVAGSGDVSSGELSFDDMKYALSYENVFLSTNVVLYGTYTSDVYGAGLELKRTIAGFDVYGQGICRYADETHKVVATGGFYRLWETEGPDFGINAEYQYIHDETATLADVHKIALETGIKQMGKKKNLKLGTQWGHNFSDDSGFANVAFLVGDLLPHANWTNAVGVTYKEDFSEPEITVGSTISISIKY